MLVVLSGLPGVGKTAIARELARQIGAVHLRIDSIEDSLRVFGIDSRSMRDAGYRVAYAVAEDNLRIGRIVIVDSVNPIPLTRDAWVEVAARAQTGVIEIEVRCSDLNEHRRRVETRIADIAGLAPLTWEDVVTREYHPWNREHLVIETADRTIEEDARLIRGVIARQNFHPMDILPL